MQKTIHLPIVTLLLMISFASVNAVLFTPALPMIAADFGINTHVAQFTISWYLIGYAIGQLFYGPLANRFGRKPALYVGISVQIFSSLFCIIAGYSHLYPLLVLSRFTMALGAGVGLKMAFTLVNECYPPKVASQKMTYIMLAFAFTPSLGIALGGILAEQYGWTACFAACALYGVLLLALVTRLPETAEGLDKNALKFKHLLSGYKKQIKNVALVRGGLLLGSGTCFVYVFAAMVPFIAINMMGMTTASYGLANLIPPIGLIVGSLISARLVKRIDMNQIIRMGIVVSSAGVMLMSIAMTMQLSPLFCLFIPTIFIYFGSSFIAANASTLALDAVKDKAHGSAMMNFINMSLTTVVVLSVGLVSIHAIYLPIIYAAICFLMVCLACIRP